MKKLFLILLILILIFPISAQAIDGEIGFGYFINGDLRAYPDGGESKYMTYMEMGHNFDFFRPYLELITLMDNDNNGGFFHPASIEYIVGIEVPLKYNFVLELQHSCWHPIDRGGIVEDYNLIKIKYTFGK